jgi:hypothetical protein
MINKRKKFILTEYVAAEKRIEALTKELYINDDPILKKLLECERAEISKKLNQIEEAIKALESYNQRNVLWWTYIGDIVNGKRKRLTRWEIGNKLGFSDEWVKDVYEKALENLNI